MSSYRLVTFACHLNILQEEINDFIKPKPFMLICVGVRAAATAAVAAHRLTVQIGCLSRGAVLRGAHVPIQTVCQLPPNKDHQNKKIKSQLPHLFVRR